MKEKSRAVFEKEANVLGKMLMYIYMFHAEEVAKAINGLRFLDAKEIHAYNIAMIGNFSRHSQNGVKELLKAVPEGKDYYGEYLALGECKEFYAGLFYHDGQVDPAAQASMSNLKNENISFALARYPYASPDILSKLSRENNEALWLRIVQNKNTSAHTLAQLSTKKSERVLSEIKKVIESGKLSSKGIDTLYYYGSDELIDVLTKSNMSPRLLCGIIKNTKREDIISNVLRNPNTPLDLLRETYDNPELREQTQAALLQRGDGIRVLEEKINPEIPTSFLTMIAKQYGLKDESVAKLLELNYYPVLEALKNNRTISEEMKERVQDKLEEFECTR